MQCPASLGFGDRVGAELVGVGRGVAGDGHDVAGADAGERGAIDGGPRSASVVAETPLRLLVIKRRDFSTLLREATDLTQNLLVTLSHRVRHAEAGLND